MGCDIHTFVETKTFRNQRDNKINNVLDEYSDELLEWETVGKEEGTYYSERNYYVYAMLADVRNYDGGVIPISQPKGVPKDASEIYKKYSDDWNGDGHSHSYFTLSELSLDVNYADYNQDMLDKFYKLIDNMKSIQKELGLSSDDVRFVFLFDN